MFSGLERSLRDRGFVSDIVRDGGKGEFRGLYGVLVLFFNKFMIWDVFLSLCVLVFL